MHIFLIEDDPLIASGIQAGLVAQGMTVDHVACASHAKTLLKTANFDVVILDLGLPDEDGLVLLSRLREQGMALPVLVLTARDAISDRVAGLQAGADDYLVKPFDLRELSARLHAMRRRSDGRSVNLVRHGELAFDPQSGDTWLGSERVDLSRRERALLDRLLRNKDRILSADQLKDAVYGVAEDVESNALNVHIHHLRRKLGSGIIQTVRGMGYRLGNPTLTQEPPK